MMNAESSFEEGLEVPREQAQEACLGTAQTYLRLNNINSMKVGEVLLQEKQLQTNGEGSQRDRTMTSKDILSH